MVVAIVCFITPLEAAGYRGFMCELVCMLDLPVCLNVFLCKTPKKCIN